MTTEEEEQSKQNNIAVPSVAEVSETLCSGSFETVQHIQTENLQRVPENTSSQKSGNWITDEV